MCNPGKDEVEQHTGAQSCNVELCPIPGHQNDLTHKTIMLLGQLNTE